MHSKEHWKHDITIFSRLLRKRVERVDPSKHHYLDMSNNNLSGRIPTGSQLQTLEPSIYVGNTDLCGAPLSKNCSMHEDPTLMPKNIYKAHDEPNKVWFYLDLTCGFATGFWGFIMVLVFKKEWRHKLFMFAEDTVDNIYVVVMIRVNKMKREEVAYRKSGII
ncbi:hypothetical protein SSX86_011621 [Deinandra increscens subsp. villosa]|uniref:Uncharacterized protein n=1 Tax=Deinandra increscens subsp. villosa TaxID=3103831 RepID=A0AAP0D2N5_9ASTR